MALVLSMREGNDFYVGHEQFVVSTIFTETHFTLTHTKSGNRFDITDTKATEILPDVMVSAGDRQQAMMARVAIEAPSDILVLRGDKYRRGKPT